MITITIICIIVINYIVSTIIFCPIVYFYSCFIDFSLPSPSLSPQALSPHHFDCNGNDNSDNNSYRGTNNDNDNDSDDCNGIDYKNLDDMLMTVMILMITMITIDNYHNDNTIDTEDDNSNNDNGKMANNSYNQ